MIRSPNSEHVANFNFIGQVDTNKIGCNKQTARHMSDPIIVP